MNLGKALVTELGLDNSVDTFARWMAHYVAEQIVVAETATANSKAIAEKNCFETILKLWEHQESFPRGRRPFENFEPIFRALERLDPEKDEPFFWANLDDSPKGNVSEDVKYWLDVASGIDKVARIWLDYVFKQAALCATDDKTKSWIKNTVGLDKKESSVIVKFLTEDGLDNEMTSESNKRELINSRIQQLQSFNDFNKKLMAIFERELEIMSKDA
ncbi:hypothetical protein [Cohnella sp. GCM10012308]|uniref:hypothetical protein n=1 Tax=Cohnella sp. GCM10012308 TaxID=3317329 RepID=UPI00361481AA